MYAAKSLSRKDDYDVALWEYLCHLLASKAGINAAETRVIAMGERFHTLLSKRFDRSVNHHRRAVERYS